MPSSWLFTRADESVFISRADKFTVVVAGPGHERQQLEFEHERAVQRYQQEVAEKMAAGGWILYAVDRQRRTRERSERQGAQERRARN